MQTATVIPFGRRVAASTVDHMLHRLNANLGRTVHRNGRDPILDIVMELIEFSDMRWSEIVRRSSISWATLYNWRDGKVKRPQLMSVRMVLRAIGFDFRLVRAA